MHSIVFSRQYALIFKNNLKLNAVLQEQNQYLQRNDQLKDEFLANTSHELRPPINGIIGLTEAFLNRSKETLSSEDQKDMKIVIVNSHRLINIIGDILDVSKLRYHDLQIHPRPLNIQALIQGTLALLAPLLEQKSLQLINDVSDDLPLVMADENRIQQVVLNLIDNAIKFTHEGTIRLFAERSAEGSPEDFLTLHVADTGIGISQDKQAKIFEFFEQADGSITREYGGTGLGLSISKQLGLRI